MFNKVFHYFHHPFWGFSPYFLETSIWFHLCENLTKLSQVLGESPKQRQDPHHASAVTRAGDPGGITGCFKNLGGDFKYFYFHPYLRKISNLTNIVQMG